jgi:hypothetical protein
VELINPEPALRRLQATVTDRLKELGLTMDIFSVQVVPDGGLHVTLTAVIDGETLLQAPDQAAIDAQFQALVEADRQAAIDQQAEDARKGLEALRKRLDDGGGFLD